MEANNEKTKPPMTKKYAVGVVVILAGLALLAYNFGFLTHYWKEIFFSWQMLLIVIGLITLLHRDNWVPGVILLSVGGFFLLPRLFDLPDNFIRNFWPLVLIAAGLVMIFRLYPKAICRKKEFPGMEHTSHEGYIHEETVFGDSKQRVTNQDFRGGYIHCVFGGVELDLTQARMAEGTNILEVSAVFGGVTVIVPPDWKVEMKMSSVLGGFADKRVYVKENPDPSRLLVIKGSAVFGGGELKSY